MTSVKNQIGPIEDSITKELFVSCRHAHATYQRKPKSPVHDIRATKETKESSQKEKRKKEVHGEHHSSRKKKERLGKMVQELFKEADALARATEANNRMDLLLKSNILRTKFCKKRKEIEKEEIKLY